MTRPRVRGRRVAGPEAVGLTPRERGDTDLAVPTSPPIPPQVDVVLSVRQERRVGAQVGPVGHRVQPARFPAGGGHRPEPRFGPEPARVQDRPARAPGARVAGRQRSRCASSDRRPPASAAARLGEEGDLTPVGREEGAHAAVGSLEPAGLAGFGRPQPYAPLLAAGARDERHPARVGRDGDRQAHRGAW